MDRRKKLIARIGFAIHDLKWRKWGDSELNLAIRDQRWIEARPATNQRERMEREQLAASINRMESKWDRRIEALQDRLKRMIGR